jgi:hypothetical protein
MCSALHEKVRLGAGIMKIACGKSSVFKDLKFKGTGDSNTKLLQDTDFYADQH